MTKKTFYILTAAICLAVTLPVFPVNAENTSIFNPDNCTGQPLFGNYKICTFCDFLVVLQNFVNLIVIIVIPIGAFMIGLGGIYILVSGGNESKITQGRKWVTSAAVGVAITLGAWLIINEVLGLLAGNYFQAPWNEIACEAEAPLPNPAPIAPGPSYNFSGKVDSPVGAGQVQDGWDMSTPQAQAAINQDLANPEGKSWNNNNPKNYACKLSQVSPYVAQINAAAQAYGVKPSRIQATIMAESSGNADAQSFQAGRNGQFAYGLMQIQPGTARTIDPSGTQGLSDAQVIDKLKDPNYNIPMGAKYFASLANKYGNYTKASSAYNGGPMANMQSINCGAPFMRWQCIWDNNAHTVPNTGYNETRDYVNKVYSMESKIDNGTCGA